MTTAQAARLVGVTPKYLLAAARAKGVLPKHFVETGKRGRPSYDWTHKQALAAKGA